MKCLMKGTPMIFKSRKIFTLALYVSCFLFVQGCVNSSESRLEEVRSLLDKGRFDDALALAQVSVDEDPENLQARSYLAEANLGAGALSGTPDCPVGDTGVLGLLACLQDDAEAGQSKLQTFRRIAPANATKVAQIEAATDQFQELAGSAISNRNIYLLLFLSRLFEISGALTLVDSNCVIGADFDGTRFSANLDALPSDGANAGLPSDLSLFNSINEINTALEITAAGNFPTFFTNELCN